MTPDYLTELEAFAERGEGADVPALMIVLSAAVASLCLVAAFWL